MKCGEYDSPAFVTSLRNGPYSSLLATSASASSASVCSDASSQSSDDSSSSTHTADSDLCDSHCQPRQAASCVQDIRFTSPWSKSSLPPPPADATALPAELRQNPRRTSTGSTSRTGCPPTLIRQCERKVTFVDSLVDTSTQIVEAVWPLSTIVCRNDIGNKAVLPLRTFIQETLRRSRTSYSTLQVALYYLILIKPHVPKHDFTMEQPDDSPASRALQCGRRMFLSALILASKYVQDRNYSARAWSKISGLNTPEINQNEITFLYAIKWKLHVTDEVFQRWTEIVLKHTPGAPPPPGAPCQAYIQQVQDWKALVLKLEPGLDNITSLPPFSPISARARDLPALSPRSVVDSSSPYGLGYDSLELCMTPKPRLHLTPAPLEPTPATVYNTPGRLAPAFGLLPTPRLTPQTSGFNTPAVSAASYLLGKNCAMGMAMAQASSVAASQFAERWPSSSTTSPQIFFPTRRSSLANSVSTASSPESMISDSSRTSRSSSISSAASLASAPPTKLGHVARFRHAKLCGERMSLRPTIASVPEDYEANCITSSPESYTGPVGKLGELSLDTPLARRERELENMVRDSADDAACAFRELPNYQSGADMTPTARAGSKRSRTASVSDSLQENVREMLRGRFYTQSESWPDTLVRTRVGAIRESELSQHVPVRTNVQGGRKRVCCSTEASEGFEASLMHPAIGGLRGPGMWEGILN